MCSPIFGLCLHLKLWLPSPFYKKILTEILIGRLNLMASQQSREFSKAHRDYRDKFIKRRLGQ